MKRKIVIIGGGFGGVYTAKALAKIIKRRRIEDLEIELISDRNYLVFHPLLPEISAGTINAQDAVSPLRLLLKDVQIRLAEVIDIDFEKSCVRILQGQRKLIQEVSYDEVVIATGQITDLTLFPGFDQHSMVMKDVSDAYFLRNKIISCLEMADITRFPEIKRRALTFVVAGGGFSGVETMGEIVEMIRRALKFYPNISLDEISPVLIQRGDSLLPEMKPKLSAYTLKALEKRGVKVMLKTGIASATKNCVTTDNGQRIEAMTTVTTIGNGPSPFVKSLGIKLSRGKIPVTRDLQVVGHNDVWSLGDTAKIPLNDSHSEPLYAPPTAQFTVREASCLAENLVARHQSIETKPFSYKPRGMLASLGAYQGVAEIFGVKMTGLPAWLIWRALYIGMLPGFSTRLRVVLNWAFDYILPRTVVQMPENRRAASRYEHFAQGDTIFSAGQVIEGFYVLVEGKLRLRAEACDVLSESDGAEVASQGCFEREIMPGDHIGERVISTTSICAGNLVALEDSKLLVVQTEDFLRLVGGFQGMEDYFNQLDENRYVPGRRH